MGRMETRKNITKCGQGQENLPSSYDLWIKTGSNSPSVTKCSQRQEMVQQNVDQYGQRQEKVP